MAIYYEICAFKQANRMKQRTWKIREFSNDVTGHIETKLDIWKSHGILLNYKTSYYLKNKYSDMICTTTFLTIPLSSKFFNNLIELGERRFKP